MNILGISAFYHDSAACLVRDGEIVAAAQEERFTRKKYDAAFPKKAVEYCLQEADIRTEDLDYVGFYDKPFVKFERLLETYLSIAPKGLKQFLSAMPIWLKEKLWTRSNIRKKLEYYGPVLFSEHHESHAASAFYPSPFKEAIVFFHSYVLLLYGVVCFLWVLLNAPAVFAVQYDVPILVETEQEADGAR